MTDCCVQTQMSEGERKQHQCFMIMAAMVPFYYFMGFASGSATALDCSIGGLVFTGILVIGYFFDKENIRNGPQPMGLPEIVVLGGMMGAVMTLPVVGLLSLIGLQ